jgi:hypothetical protein
MKFKKGDMVVAKDDWGYDWHVSKGHVYKVIESVSTDYDRIYIEPISHIRENVRGSWSSNKFELAYYDNKLNRALYPDFIVFGDYLVPSYCKEILCG